MSNLSRRSSKSEGGSEACPPFVTRCQPPVIASEAKQSIAPQKERTDCFAALAMTPRAERLLLQGRRKKSPAAPQLRRMGRAQAKPIASVDAGVDGYRFAPPILRMSQRLREPARVDPRRDIAAVDPRLREDAATDQMRRAALVSWFSNAIDATSRSAGAAMRRYSWTNNGLPLFSPGPCRASSITGF